jgi:hypothetical protein
VIVRVLRITATWLVLAATVLLVAGCASSSHTSASTAALIAGPPISDAQALAYAHAVNLRAGDVPETTSKRTAESVDTVRGRRKPSAFRRCVGLPAPSMVLKIHSAIFGAPYWWLRSTVEVMPSKALAAADVAIFASSRDWHCFLPPQAELQAKLKMAFSAIPVTPPIVGLRVTQDAGTFETYQDIFTFAFGRAVVTLSTSGSKTPALTTEQRLASLLYSRAEAHKLS